MVQILVGLYVMELFSESLAWTTVAHHCMTAICVCILVDATHSSDEVIQGVIFLAYVSIELNIYASLLLHNWSRILPDSVRLRNYSIRAKRASIWLQTLSILANQIVSLWWLLHHSIYPAYVAVFLVSDVAWFMEQCWALKRSCRSLRKDAPVSFAEKCIESVAHFIAVFPFRFPFPPLKIAMLGVFLLSILFVTVVLPLVFL